MDLRNPAILDVFSVYLKAHLDPISRLCLHSAITGTKIIHITFLHLFSLGRYPNLIHDFSNCDVEFPTGGGTFGEHDLFFISLRVIPIKTINDIREFILATQIDQPKYTKARSGGNKYKARLCAYAHAAQGLKYSLSEQPFKYLLRSYDFRLYLILFTIIGNNQEMINRLIAHQRGRENVFEYAFSLLTKSYLDYYVTFSNPMMGVAVRKSSNHSSTKLKIKKGDVRY